MVRLYLDYPDSSTDVTWCTGVIIAPGTIATAAHCVSEHECSRVRPYQIYARFGTGLFLRFWNPQRGISVLPGYRCEPNHASRDDLAIFRFVDRWGFPAIPIATPAQVERVIADGSHGFVADQEPDPSVVLIAAQSDSASDARQKRARVCHELILTGLLRGSAYAMRVP